MNRRRLLVLKQKSHIGGLFAAGNRPECRTIAKRHSPFALSAYMAVLVFIELPDMSFCAACMQSNLITTTTVHAGSQCNARTRMRIQQSKSVKKRPGMMIKLQLALSATIQIKCI